MDSNSKRMVRSIFGLFAVAVILALPRAAAAQVTPFRVVEKDLPFATTMTNPCTSDSVDLTGLMTVKSRMVEDAHGGFHFTTSVRAMGTGVGTPSGVTYTFTEKDRALFDLNALLGTETTALSIKISLRGPAKGDDWLVGLQLRITLDLNGNVTHFIERITAECR